MGSDLLWKYLIDQADTSRSFAAVIIGGATVHHETGHAEFRGFRLGIDSRIWLSECEQAFRQNHCLGFHGCLRTIFYRLGHLSSLPVIPIVVFDGPHCPTYKHSKSRYPPCHTLTAGFRQLLDAFGFSYREASGEANAELAAMNSLGVIDAVLTDDSDVFTFSAKMVIRNSSFEKVTDAATVYTSMHHSRTTFALMSLLLDAYSEDLAECQLRITHGLAQYGVGQELLDVATQFRYNQSALTNALATWRCSVQEHLRTDTLGHIGHRYPSVADSFPPALPNIDALNRYIHPTTPSRRRSLSEISLSFTTSPLQFNLSQLTLLCELWFSWRT